MILPIVLEPNPILHQVAEPITEITPEIRQLVADMRETMKNAKGIGLAAPQIGKSLAICVVELQDEDDEDAIDFIALINPRVTNKGFRQVNFVEACLSIPGVEGSVRRSDKIRVKAKNLEGDMIEIETDGLFARVLQHEIDHLNGILFTSYVPKKALKKRSIDEYPTI